MEVICFRCDADEIPDVRYGEKIKLTEEDSSKAALLLFRHIQRFYACNSPVKYKDTDGDMVLLENEDAYKAAINDFRSSPSGSLILFIHGSHARRCNDGNYVKQQIQSETRNECERNILKLQELVKGADALSMQYFCLDDSCSRDPLSNEEIVEHDLSHPVVRLPFGKKPETLGVNVHNLSDSSFMNFFSKDEALDFKIRIYKCEETVLWRNVDNRSGIYMYHWGIVNEGTAVLKNVQVDVISSSLGINVLGCCVTRPNSLKYNDMEIMLWIKAPIDSHPRYLKVGLLADIGDSSAKRYLNPVLAILLVPSLSIVATLKPRQCSDIIKPADVTKPENCHLIFDQASLDSDAGVRALELIQTEMVLSSSLKPILSRKNDLIIFSSETFSNENTDVSNTVKYFCLFASCSQNPLSGEEFVRHDPSHPLICLPVVETLETLGIKIYDLSDLSLMNFHSKIKASEAFAAKLLRSEKTVLWRKIDNRIGTYMKHWRVKNVGTATWKNIQVDMIAISLHMSVLNYCITPPNALDAGQTMDIIVWVNASSDSLLHFAKFRLSVVIGDSPTERYFGPLLVLNFFTGSPAYNILNTNRVSDVIKLPGVTKPVNCHSSPNQRWLQDYVRNPSVASSFSLLSDFETIEQVETDDDF